MRKVLILLLLVNILPLAFAQKQISEHWAKSYLVPNQIEIYHKLTYGIIFKTASTNSASVYWIQANGKTQELRFPDGRPVSSGYQIIKGIGDQLLIVEKSEDIGLRKRQVYQLNKGEVNLLFETNSFPIVWGVSTSGIAWIEKNSTNDKGVLKLLTIAGEIKNIADGVNDLYKGGELFGALFYIAQNKVFQVNGDIINTIYSGKNLSRIIHIYPNINYRGSTQNYLLQVSDSDTPIMLLNMPITTISISKNIDARGFNPIYENKTKDIVGFLTREEGTTAYTIQNLIDNRGGTYVGGSGLLHYPGYTGTSHLPIMYNDTLHYIYRKQGAISQKDFLISCTMRGEVVSIYEDTHGLINHEGFGLYGQIVRKGDELTFVNNSLDTLKLLVSSAKVTSFKKSVYNYYDTNINALVYEEIDINRIPKEHLITIKRGIKCITDNNELYFFEDTKDDKIRLVKYNGTEREVLATIDESYNELTFTESNQNLLVFATKDFGKARKLNVFDKRKKVIYPLTIPLLFNESIHIYGNTVYIKGVIDKNYYWVKEGKVYSGEVPEQGVFRMIGAELFYFSSEKDKTIWKVTENKFSVIATGFDYRLTLYSNSELILSNEKPFYYILLEDGRIVESPVKVSPLHFFTPWIGYNEKGRYLITPQEAWKIESTGFKLAYRATENTHVHPGENYYVETSINKEVSIADIRSQQRYVFSSNPGYLTSITPSGLIFYTDSSYHKHITIAGNSIKKSYKIAPPHDNNHYTFTQVLKNGYLLFISKNKVVLGYTGPDGVMYFPDLKNNNDELNAYYRSYYLENKLILDGVSAKMGNQLWEFSHQNFPSRDTDENNSDWTIELYPNPAKDLCIVRSTNQIQLELRDSKGTLLNTYQVDKFITLNLSDLSSGIYYISAKHDKNNRVIRLVKD